MGQEYQSNKSKGKVKSLTLPGNPYQEAALLGLILVVGDDVAKVAAKTLSITDFVDPKCKLIFSVVKKLVEEEEPVTVSTIIDRFSSSEAAYVTSEYLFQLTDYVIEKDSQVFEGYVKKIKESAVARNLIQFCKKVATDFDEFDFAKDGDWDGFSEDVKRKVEKLVENNSLNSTISAKEVADATLEQIKATKEANKNNGLIGVETGIQGVNKLTHGWRPGQLGIIAGKTSMGKSALAIHCAFSAAKANFETAFYSLEMTNESNMTRIFSNKTAINSDRIISGFPNAMEVQVLEHAAEVVGDLPMWFCDRLTGFEDIEADITNLKSKRPDLKVVFIDYLQLMTTKRKGMERYLEIGYMTSSLKRLAQRLGITVIALSQLRRDDKEDAPTLSDLKESGSIENDASWVIFIHRPDYYEEKHNTNSAFSDAEIIVAKNREGETGVVWTVFNKATSNFTPMSKEREAALNGGQSE